MVDGAELLVALPGQVHLPSRVAGLQAGGDLGLLTFGEVFDPMPEQPTDLVERVVFVAAVAEGVLLDAAADLVDDLGAEPDYVEGVEDGDRVGQLVSDGVGVAAERVQRCLLDVSGEPLRLVVQPPLVGGSGPADDGVEQPRVQASVLVTGEIDP